MDLKPLQLARSPANLDTLSHIPRLCLFFDWTNRAFVEDSKHAAFFHADGGGENRAHRPRHPNLGEALRRR